MDVSSISRIGLSPSVQHRGFGEGEETEPPPAKRRGSLELSGIGALTLNIGGRNTNPVEFVLEGDESELGIACTALGVQLLEAAGSDTCGPSALPEAERRAVDAVWHAPMAQLNDSDIFHQFRCEDPRLLLVLLQY